MRDEGYTVIVQKNGALASRQFQVRSWLVRAVTIAATALVIVLVVLVATYGPILAAAARAPLLQRRVQQLTRENARVGELAKALNDAEARYAHLRGCWAPAYRRRGRKRISLPQGSSSSTSPRPFSPAPLRWRPVPGGRARDPPSRTGGRCRYHGSARAAWCRTR